jgi:FKBP-type peptidyl-prolyl cis-trans isomerase SlyD
MQITKDTVVTLEYRVTDSDGAIVDEGKHPLTYLHGGYGGIFDRIEVELQGKSAGEKLEVKLLPEEAFGDYDETLIAVEQRSMFPENIEVGMQFERGGEDEDDDGILYTITDIADEKVVVDGNHPLAGQALIFSCTVKEVRKASAEELSHGHVHGPGGHHH